MYFATWSLRRKRSNDTESRILFKTRREMTNLVSIEPFFLCWYSCHIIFLEYLTILHSIMFIFWYIAFSLYTQLFDWFFISWFSWYFLICSSLGSLRLSELSRSSWQCNKWDACAVFFLYFFLLDDCEERHRTHFLFLLKVKIRWGSLFLQPIFCLISGNFLNNCRFGGRIIFYFLSHGSIGFAALSWSSDPNY